MRADIMVYGTKNNLLYRGNLKNTTKEAAVEKGKSLKENFNAKEVEVDLWDGNDFVCRVEL